MTDGSNYPTRDCFIEDVYEEVFRFDPELGRWRAKVGERSIMTYETELRGLVEWMDADLDENVAAVYKDQPLAQDWARVGKLAEEMGEAIADLVGFTGQNPRKGVTSSQDEMLIELADCALTALYAIQHFVKDGHAMMAVLLTRARHHRQRREDQIASVTLRLEPLLAEREASGA